MGLFHRVGVGLVFQLVSLFYRYWASSSKSTVWPKMESYFQDGACSVCFLLHSVRGIFPARILEWIYLSSSRASSHPRVRTPVSCISCMTVFVVTFSLISSKHIADILLKAIHSRFYLGNILYTTYLLCKTHK